MQIITLLTQFDSSFFLLLLKTNIIILILILILKLYLLLYILKVLYNISSNKYKI